MTMQIKKYIPQLMRKKTTFCFLLLSLAITGFTQQKETIAYKLLAQPQKDTVLLRWAPVDYQSWLVGNKYGYYIWRGTVLRGGEYVDSEGGKLLNKIPIKPAPLAQWEQAVDEDDYAGVAAQALYGEDFMVETNQSPSISDIFYKEKEQTARFSFALMAADLSVETAKLSGLWFTDSNVKSNETYLYKIWPAHQPENTIVDTAFVYTGPSEYRPLPKPLDLKAQSGDKVVNLQWDNQLQSQHFNAFYIERSDNIGKNYKRITESPLINTTPEGQDELSYAYFMDSIPNNYQSYYYRVIGISPFGELSPPSDVVEVVGQSKINFAPTIIGHEVINNNEVVLKWELNEKESHKVEGLKILRATKIKGDYEIIKDSLSPIYQQYTDKNPISTAYYRIQPYNKSGLGPASQGSLVQLQDSIPPSAPVNIIAEADTTGVVNISWKANTESDIYGYRVYRANGLNEEFSQITISPIKNNSFVDHITLKTLSKYVYYKIMAVDKRQNYSKFSKAYQLNRPDIVPPAPPAIREIKPTQKGVFIRWVKSSSIDVNELNVYRNRVGSREWKVVNSTPNNDITLTWTDSLVTASTTYRYLMMAVDSAGNESIPTQPMSVKTFNPVNKASLSIKVKYDKKSDCVRLNWENTYNIKNTLIYRKINDGKLILLDNVSNQMYYQDYKIQSGNTCEYKIRHKYTDGTLSNFSPSVNLIVK